MLEMRDQCERCATPLPVDSADARICSLRMHFLRDLASTGPLERPLPQLQGRVAGEAEADQEVELKRPLPQAGFLTPWRFHFPRAPYFFSKPATSPATNSSCLIHPVVAPDASRKGTQLGVDLGDVGGGPVGNLVEAGNAHRFEHRVDLWTDAFQQFEIVRNDSFRCWFGFPLSVLRQPWVLARLLLATTADLRFCRRLRKRLWSAAAVALTATLGAADFCAVAFGAVTLGASDLDRQLALPPISPPWQQEPWSAQPWLQQPSMRSLCLWAEQSFAVRFWIVHQLCSGFGSRSLTGGAGTALGGATSLSTDGGVPSRFESMREKPPQREP